LHESVLHESVPRKLEQGRSNIRAVDLQKHLSQSKTCNLCSAPLTQAGQNWRRAPLYPKAQRPSWNEDVSVVVVGA
jgi:hypothetical protein